MKITLLGTGTSTGVPLPGCDCDVCTSSNPKNKRLRCSVYIEYQERDFGNSNSAEVVSRILVDTGPDFRYQVLRANINSLDAVLYTHSHADHIMGMDDLRIFNFLQKKAIPIYASDSTLNEIKRIFSYIFSPDPNYQGGALAKLEVNKIESGRDFQIGEKSLVRPLSLIHGKQEILGYRFNKFAYMTDCSEIPDETFQQLSGVETVVIDGLRIKPHKTHFTFEQAAKAVERIAPSKAYLTHVSHDIDYDRGNKHLKDISDMNIEVAYDGLVIEH